jgi:rubrerythrin
MSDKTAIQVLTESEIIEELEILASYYGNDHEGNETKEHRVLTAAIAALREQEWIPVEIGEKPEDAILFCPNCKTQHIDKAEPDVCELCGIDVDAHDATGCDEFKAWLNPPHKKHRCHECNHVWRAANVPTNGVASLEATDGK